MYLYPNVHPNVNFSYLQFALVGTVSQLMCNQVHRMEKESFKNFIARGCVHKPAIVLRMNSRFGGIRNQQNVSTTSYHCTYAHPT